MLNEIKQLYKEINKMTILGNGASTFTFTKSEKSKVAYCYTIDKSKFKWLKANKKLNFKLLDTKIHNKVKVYKYRVTKLHNPTEDEICYVTRFFLKYVMELKVIPYTVNSLKSIKPFTNNYFKKLINKLVKVYGGKTDNLDLHNEQFMVDSKGNFILLEATHDSDKIRKKTLKLEKVSK